MTTRAPLWVVNTLLCGIALCAVVLYVAGDHRAGLMTAGEVVFLSILTHGWRWRKDTSGSAKAD
jgi:hypothetical protein